MNVQVSAAEKPMFDHSALLNVLRHHPLMLSRVISLAPEAGEKYGRGELHGEFDIAANHVHAMAKANLVSPCEQALAFYLHQVLDIPAAMRTYLVSTSGFVYRHEAPIPDGENSIGIWLEVLRINAHDRYADAHANGRVGYSRARPLILVQNLIVRIEV